MEEGVYSTNQDIGERLMRFLLIMLCLLSVSSHAAFNLYVFGDQNQELRFQQLIDDLRCPKCKNNNLSDSNAALATDIKNYVYESVKSGKSDEEITDFLISRYGLFIIYDPKIIWIWLVPVAVVLFGLVWAIRRIRYSQTVERDDLPSMATLIAEYERNQREK